MSRFNIKQSLSRVALVATLAAGISAAAYAAGETTTPASDNSLSLESLADLYNERITQLDFELRNETERRTSVLEQLDGVINELSELEKESDIAVQNSPQLNNNVEQISREIEEVDNNIRLNLSLIHI